MGLDKERLQRLREVEFPVASRLAYLDHAAVSPMPARTAALLAERIAALQNPSLEHGDRERLAGEATERLGRLMNVPPAQIALLTNLGEAMATVANGLDLRAGDEIVIPRMEFSSLVYPWMIQEKRGARIVWVEKDGPVTRLDRIEAAISARTRVVAVSHVEFLNGYRHDMENLGRICREHDVILAVDVTQSLGVLQVDAQRWGADVVAAHGYKWIMAMHGIAALYVSEKAMAEIQPTVPGRSSVTGGFHSLDFVLDWHPDARRYQSGGPNWTGAAAVSRSLSLTEEIGIVDSEQQATAVISHIAAGVIEAGCSLTSEPDPDRRSAIVSFTFGSETRDRDFVSSAKAAGVYVGLRNFGVRAAAHYWNDRDDAERLLEQVRHS